MMMYRESPSPRSSRQDISHGTGGHSPTKSNLRAASSTGALLSPNRSRRMSAGNRSGSPLTVPPSMEVYQNLLSDGLSTTSSVSSPGRSPFQSPAHSRSSSMTSVKSLLRDRPDHMQERHGALVRDRSLDRQLDRHHRESDRHERHYVHSARDRSLDREYPHMGARSLDREREQQQLRGNLVRSRSIDHEYLMNQAAFLPSTQDLRHARDTLILDLQSQIAELNKECAAYQVELELTREKLGSSMNSIKTFWSPELKKERVLRKEESGKITSLFEQLKMAEAEKKRYSGTVQQYEEEISILRNGGKLSSSTSALSGELEVLRKEKERQAKEIIILRKTIDEMEIRIDTQKQTLTARDESIKKLLEMLQSKGLAVKHLEEDRMEIDHLRGRLLEDERRTKQLENILEQRDKELNSMKEELSMYTEEVMKVQTDCEKARRESGSSEALQALLESKLENMKVEGQRKESELAALRTQLETYEKQGSDHQRHITVLKEQISAKDQQSSMLQSDLDLMRERMEEREHLIEKKGKQLLNVQTEKKKIEGDMAEVRDHMDIKERKISVLQRKIDNMEEMMKDRELQLDSMKQRLRSLHVDQNHSDSALSSLEDSLNEKEKQIERLKEQRDKADQEHQEEIDLLQRSCKDFKQKVDDLASELDEKQHAVLELRDETSAIKTEKMRKEAQLSQLELALAQKQDDILTLEEQVRKLKEDETSRSQRVTSESEQRLVDLDMQVKVYKEQADKTQTEVDRLLDILKEMENEKFEKDKQIQELQDQVKSHQCKVGSLKRNQNTEKKKSAQLLEEARKREDQVSDDVSQLKNDIKHKTERIEELEEALRESVKITAQREMVVAQQQMKFDQSESQVKTMVDEIEKLKKENSTYDHQMATLSATIEEQNANLRKLQEERKRHLEEAYEMKQEAILAAISEKDAHIAVLETSGINTHKSTEVERLNKEKERLQAQLKDLLSDYVNKYRSTFPNPSFQEPLKDKNTQNRMKLMQNNDHNSEHTDAENNEPSMTKKMTDAPGDQEEDDGIWA